MKFRNSLEKTIFEIANRVCGEAASIEHNKILEIENTTAIETASFVGPPKKEIDVITAGFRQNPNLQILISCKDYGTAKAEPAHVQEWAAVVRTMNHYARNTAYLGLIVCPSGFTSGCEPWATSYNLGIIPPLRGTSLKISLATCFAMFERVLKAFGRRIYFPHNDLLETPQFYEFMYRLTQGFEAREESQKQYGDRYRLLENGWLSSFSEVVRTFMGKTLQQIETTSAGVYIRFSGDLSFRVLGSQIRFGRDDGKVTGKSTKLQCEKNFIAEPCSFEFLKNLVVGQKVTSAGDWGDRFEFGLTDDLMLAIEQQRLQIYRTRNPMEANLL